MRHRPRPLRRISPSVAQARGPYTPARALRRWHLLQPAPLALHELRRELKPRGLDRFRLFDSRAFEVLDEEDLLRPVGYALHGFAWTYDLQGYLQAGDLLLRDEHGYLSWNKLQRRAEQKHDAQLYVLYHHWQIPWISELLEYLSVTTPIWDLRDGLEAFYERREEYAHLPTPLPRNVLRDRAVAARRRETLLLRVENIYFPRIRGGQYSGTHHVGLKGNSAETAIEQQRDFDPAYAAGQVRAQPDELAAATEYFTVLGKRLDPVSDLFVLLDGVSRRRLEKMSGPARLALDHYDAARVLRAWHFELTDQWLPDVDELFDAGGGTWKEKNYGSRRPARDRSTLPLLLDDFGLYPHRVELIGEGESELTALEEILSYAYGLSFDRLGIATTDLGGADVPEKARRMLGSLRRYANYFLLVLDNEGDAQEMITALVRSNVIEGIPDERRRQAVRDALESVRTQSHESPEKRAKALRAAARRGEELDREPGQAPEHIVWHDNLEADNFSSGELCLVINEEAARTGVEGFEIKGAELEAELNKPGQRKGTASVLVAMAEASDPPLRLAKPDLVRALARYAVDHPQYQGDQRPILKLAEHLVRLTWASRQVRGRLRER